MTDVAEKSVHMATAGLMKALDDSPRGNWPRVIEMAMTAVRGVGYAEGYRVGLREEPQPALAVTPPLIKPEHWQGEKRMTDSPHAVTLGEDKALADTKRTPDEEDEDRGHEFIREIARQLGREAVMMGFDPKKTKVLVRHDGEIELSIKR